MDTHDIPTGGSMRRRIIIYAVLFLAVFLIGLVPMWLVARGRAAELDAARRDLRLCRLEANLASAAVLSRRGEYEPARLATSGFFTSLHEQVDPAGQSSDLTAAQKDGLRAVLNQRDDLITLLARSDPGGADRLADLFMSYRKTMAGTQP